MKYARLYNLKAGDRIVERLFQTGLSKHHVLYLGWDHNLQEWIAENHSRFGVRIIKAEDYFATVKHIDRIERFYGRDYQRQIIINRAIALQGKPYDLIRYNCEHFVNEVIHGKPESKQVTNAGLVAATIFAGIIIFGK
jgi:hypothetical protein